MKEQPIPLAVVIIGILIAIAAIYALLKYVHDTTKNLEPREYMFRVVMICFLILVGIFAVDKVVALKRDLLTENESGIVFDTIKDFLFIVTSFYFGTQASKDRL